MTLLKNDFVSLNMASDFSKLEKAVSGEFGSSKDLIKKVINDLEVYEGDF